METIKIIDPYQNYEMVPQEPANGTYGNELLNSVKSLQVGFGSKVLRIDRDGLWLGAESFASAPFSVDMLGNMVATSLDLSAYLQVGQSLSDIQALIGDISDIDNDLGTITAGNLVGLTVTGGLIRTSSSGARVEIDGSTDTIEIYDATRRRMELDGDEFIFYDANGAETGSLSALQVNIIGLTFPNTKLGFVVYSSTTAKFAVSNTSVVCYDTLDMQSNDIDNLGTILTTFSIDGDMEPFGGAEDVGNSTAPFDQMHSDDFYGLYNAPSDRRLKTDIQDIPNALNDLLTLRPVTFKYKEKKYKPINPKLARQNPELASKKEERMQVRNAERMAETHYGFIAQEARQVFPNLVKKQSDPKAMLSLKYDEVIPLLVRAIQELKAEIELLKQ